MKSCRRIMRLMGAHLDGELANSEGQVVEEHVAKCPPCAQVRKDFLRLSRLLAPKKCEPGADEDLLWKQFDADLAHRIEQETVAPPRGFVVSPAMAAAIAMLFLSVTASGLFSFQQNRRLLAEKAALQERLIQVQTVSNTRRFVAPVPVGNSSNRVQQSQPVIRYIDTDLVNYQGELY